MTTDNRAWTDSWSRKMNRSEIAGMAPDKLREVSAGMGTFAGARAVTLQDGVERGVRLIEMCSGGGLDLDVIVDRSGDIGRLSCDGQVLSWHPPGGLASPWLMDREGDRGQGFLRGYGGFLNTCGLDHIRQPEQDSVEQTNQETLREMDFPLHGKGTFHPGVIRGYGLVDDVDVPYVFCETEFVQAMSFVSALRLRRRIEMPVGSRMLTIRDVVRNVGNNAASHMLMYHYNLGFPIVAPGTEIDMGPDDCSWQSAPHDPLAPFPTPEGGSENKISVFRHGTETGRAVVKSPKEGMAVHFEYPASQLPCCQVLRMTAPGIYGIGIEPCTTGLRTRGEAREQGELIILQPGEERRYDVELMITKNLL
jgi:hypothetical protein